MKRLIKANIGDEQEKKEILEAVFGEETSLLDEFHKNIDEIFVSDSQDNK